ncbi:MAG TPA: prepilin-type N-terminal cleavage/methylation domain-containing protein [Blastocatellia bacterium]|nr:prepilin-type N-terminal cleavage/methylation domain-containing protein [Blastocatellia bacterium]
MSDGIGSRIESRGLRIACRRDASVKFHPRSSIFASDGFTLLELVMVMTIIVILAAVGVTSYQQIQLKARETILKEDLRTMRRMIDQYAADKEKLPQSLDDLVTGGYMREVPIDPITGEKDWVVDMGDDTVSRDGGTGVVDVHSAAAGEGSDGAAYKDY